MKFTGLFSFFLLMIHFSGGIAASAEVQAKTYIHSNGSSKSKPVISEEIPSPIISLGEDGDGSIALVVEKATQRLHIYDRKYNIIKTLQVTTGRRPGNKLETGDEKTPEGVYFIQGINHGNKLPSKYGIMALPLNYPNHLDTLHGKNGYGIWLHATDQPTRPIKPFDTKGCVVTTNEDIAELARHIRLQTTPVVIVDKLEYRSVQGVEEEAGEIKQFLNTWKGYWEGKKLNEYMDCYSKKFKSKGMGWEEWKRYKNDLNQRYSSIEVSLKDVKLLRQGDYVVASFTQDYRSDKVKNIGVKKLYIEKQEGKWRIIGEECLPPANVDIARIVDKIPLPKVVAVAKRDDALPRRQANLKIKKRDEKEISPVAIEEFKAEGEKGLKVTFKLINKKGAHQTISGRVAIVAATHDGGRPLFDTHPSMTLRAGLPKDFRNGEWFSIKRFKVVEGEMKKAAEFKAVKVLIYSPAGRVLLEREFSVDREKERG